MKIRFVAVEDMSTEDVVFERFKEVAKSFQQPLEHLATFRTLEKAEDQLSEDRSADLVLLDLIGVVAPKETEVTFSHIQSSVARIHTVAPEIPVVVFSNSPHTEHVLNAWHAGACSYIQKNTLTSMTSASPSARDDELEVIEAALAKIVSAVSQYRSKKAILHEPLEQGRIVKRGRVNSDGAGRIVDQIEFLKRVADLRALAEYFPKPESPGPTPNKKFLEYRMPHYRMPSLAKEISETTDADLSKDRAEAVLHAALDVLVNKLHTVGSRKTGSNFLNEDCIGPIKRRVDLMRKLSDSEEIRSSGFKSCLASKSLSFSGEKYTPPSEIIQHIESEPSVQMLLVPPRLNLIHGDLHFDNILVRWDFPDHPRFKFIDPKGVRNGTGIGDAAVDFGRLLWSAEAYYDLFRKGYLQYHPSDRTGDDWGELGWVDLVPKPVGEGASGDSVTSHEWGQRSEAMSVYDHSTIIIKRAIADFAEKNNDPKVGIRAQFYSAVAMCTVAPLYAEKNSRLALGMWLRGAQLLGKWFTEHCR